MPTDTVFYRWVPKDINPPEAHEIGDRLFIAGVGLGLLAAVLDWKKDMLRQSWSGKAQDSFYENRGFGRAPDRLEELGERIQEHGERIRDIIVTVWEQVPIPPDEIRWEGRRLSTGPSPNPPPYRLQNLLRPLQDILIPEAQHAISSHD